MTTNAAVVPQTLRDTRADRRLQSVVVSTPIAGTLWFCGWLFTIGFAQLGFWKGMLALVIWPYVLGVLAR